VHDDALLLGIHTARWWGSGSSLDASFIHSPPSSAPCLQTRHLNGVQVGLQSTQAKALQELISLRITSSKWQMHTVLNYTPLHTCPHYTALGITHCHSMITCLRAIRGSRPLHQTLVTCRDFLRHCQGFPTSSPDLHRQGLYMYGGGQQQTPAPLSMGLGRHGCSPDKY
jgi:hypothetical protein